jgi:hypothetical protein
VTGTQETGTQDIVMIGGMTSLTVAIKGTGNINNETMRETRSQKRMVYIAMTSIYDAFHLYREP